MALSFVYQAGGFAVVGAILAYSKSLASAPRHRLITGAWVQKYEDVADTLSALASLNCDDELASIVCIVDEIYRHDANTVPASQGIISLKTSEAIRRAKKLCANVNRLDSDDMYRTVLWCEEDLIPQLQSQLDDILHNHILAR